MGDSTARRWQPRRPWLLIVLLTITVLTAAITVVSLWLSSRSATEPEMPAPGTDGVSGYLFQDRDGNGERGPGEPTLPGWDVHVYSTGPAPLDATATDQHGVFAFHAIDSLTPGETTVRVRVQPVLEGPAAANLPSPSALSQTFTIPLGDTQAIPVAAFRSCLSLDQCTALDLPDLAPQLASNGGDQYPAPTETRVDTTTEPGRVLLRFGTSTANLGGLLHVTAAEVAADGETQAVEQRVYGTESVYVNRAGEFVYHAEHNHFHLDEFERYELVSEDRSTVLATSGKVSFCLTDVLAVDPPERGDGDVFLDLPPFDCGIYEQGINTGYADYYGAELPDQWIDVTGVPSGTYWVRLTVDPAGVLIESDKTNNIAYFPVDYIAP